MKKIFQTAQAGTIESNDAIVIVSPTTPGSGKKIEIQSTVLAQYGNMIRKTIEQTLVEQEITDVSVNVMDRGALDCTIRARVLTALIRAELKQEEAL